MRAKRQAGQAVVELALVLPVVLVLLFGIMEAGRVIDAYLVVQNAAWVGARAGIDPGATDTSITSAAQAAAASVGSVTVAVSPDRDNLAEGQTFTVDVTYTFTFVVPLIEQIVGSGTIPVTGTSTMQTE